MGFGFEFGLATLLIMVPLVVEKRDMRNVCVLDDNKSKLTMSQAVALGAITQIRVLGGTIGLGICTEILNEHVRHSLTFVLSPQQIIGILQSVSSISTLDATAESSYRCWRERAACAELKHHLRSHKHGI